MLYGYILKQVSTCFMPPIPEIHLTRWGTTRAQEIKQSVIHAYNS